MDMQVHWFDPITCRGAVSTSPSVKLTWQEVGEDDKDHDLRSEIVLD